MKETGMVRKLDELGRIVIPMNIRNTLNLEVKDSVEIFLEGSSIILKKYESSCVFCGKSKNLTNFENKLICKSCLKKLSSLS